jgi:mannitol-1-phosphate/altronate dehydrogenase
MAKMGKKAVHFGAGNIGMSKEALLNLISQ